MVASSCPFNITSNPVQLVQILTCVLPGLSRAMASCTLTGHRLLPELTTKTARQSKALPSTTNTPTSGAGPAMPRWKVGSSNKAPGFKECSGWHAQMCHGHSGQRAWAGGRRWGSAVMTHMTLPWLRIPASLCQCSP